MTFKSGTDKFCGIIKSFSDIGYPLLELNATDAINPNRVLTKILDYYDEDAHYASDPKYESSAFFTVHLFQPFLVTHYSLRSHNTIQTTLNSWILEGSISGIDSDYEQLDKRENSLSLVNNGSIQYQINPARHIFKYFRIRGYNLPDKIMRISRLEFYGTFNYLITSKQCMKILSHSFLYLFLLYA